MTKAKNTKRALLASVLSMMLCAAMLVGSTFAWFTDTVKSGNNRIVAGNLDVELFYKNASTTAEEEGWANASAASTEDPTFFVDTNGENILWEPGVMAVTQFKVANVGSLALQYSFATLKANFNSMAGHDLSEVIKFAVVESDVSYASRDEVPVDTLEFKDFTDFKAIGHLLPVDKATTEESSEKVFTVVAYWAPNAGDVDNLYNVNNGQKTDDGADQLYIDIEIRLNATQYMYESDSFDKNYDKDAGVSTKWYDDNKDADTYELSDASELAGLSKLVNSGVSFANKTIILTEDIVLDSTNSWEPIGNYEYAFDGTFDGNGKTISNLFIKRTHSEDTTDSLCGLFGEVWDATIKNVKVCGNIEVYSEIVKDENGNPVNGYVCSGIVAHCAGHNKFENCVSYVNIDASKNNADAMLAGIVGMSMLNDGGGGNKVTIKNCKNYGNIICNNKNAEAAVAVAAGISCVKDYHFDISDDCANYGEVIAYGMEGAEVYYGDIWAMEW